MKMYNIGYTTGVFDMFHIGHLNIIMNSKRYFKHLVVGVSTDELVEEYKHKKPIIPFQERVAIVKAIRYVDEVIPQTTMNKLDAWQEIHFDVMFHGSDWKGSELYKKIVEDLKGVGADVIFLPHTEGISSTYLSDVLNNMRKE